MQALNLQGLRPLSIGNPEPPAHRFSQDVKSLSSESNRLARLRDGRLPRRRREADAERLTGVEPVPRGWGPRLLPLQQSRTKQSGSGGSRTLTYRVRAGDAANYATNP